MSWQYLCDLCFSLLWYIHPPWTNVHFKTVTQLDSDFKDEELTSAGPEFLSKAFFPLENDNWCKAKSWAYISFSFTFLINISQVWDALLHCSRTLEQEITWLLQTFWGGGGGNWTLQSESRTARGPLASPWTLMWWGFSSASFRVTLQTGLTY